MHLSRFGSFRNSRKPFSRSTLVLRNTRLTFFRPTLVMQNTRLDRQYGYRFTRFQETKTGFIRKIFSRGIFISRLLSENYPELSFSPGRFSKHFFFVLFFFSFLLSHFKFNKSKILKQGNNTSTNAYFRDKCMKRQNPRNNLPYSPTIILVCTYYILCIRTYYRCDFNQAQCEKKSPVTVNQRRVHFESILNFNFLFCSCLLSNRTI